MPDGVVIKISGDASNFEQTLKGTERTAKSAAGALGAEYKKAGMEMSAAMQKAWKEVQAAQKSGSTIKINGVDTIISESRQAQKSIKSIGDSAEKAADDVSKASGRMASGLKAVKSVASNVSSGISSVASGIAKGVGVVSKWASLLWGVAGVATVKYTSDIEQLQTSFEVMTGSADKAAQVIDRIRTMGAETPFEMGDLAETTQLLMNYSLTADDALSKMSMLGDIAQGNADKMQRIATAYGQMSSAGKVSLEDVKQMIEAGFNPLQIISEKTGESMASLYERISKGTLAVSEITAAMQAATSEGGKYYQSMEKQSQTISGMFSTVKDNLQQLGGDLFAPFTDSLRTTILPGTISIIDEISAAFKARGVDGIISVINQQTPKLISEASKLAKKAMTGVTKTLPTLVKGLLPDLIKGAVDLAPDIGDMLFDLLAEGVEIVAGSLPTLVPALSEGILKLFSSAFKGVFKVAEGLFSGLNKSLKQMGVLAWSEEELIEQALGNIDFGKVEEYRKYFEITPDVTVNEPEIELSSIYDEIETALTDGEADTEEIVNELKRKVTEYYQGQIDKVNEWREAALKGLDSTLPAEEYKTAAAEINAEADSMVAGFERASDATIAFIDENAGKATAAVQANTGELETIYQNALSYANQIAALTGESRTAVQKQQVLVAAGASSDPGVIGSAMANTASQFQTAMDELNQARADALIKAQSQYANDAEAYSRAEKQINDQFASDQSELVSEFQGNMALLWSGVSKALSPEASEAFDTVLGAQELQSKISGLQAALVSAFTNPEIQSGEISMAEYLSEVLAGAGFTEADYAVIAQAMGIDEIDPAIIQQELMTKLLQGMAGGATATDKNAFVQQMLSNMGLEGVVTQVLAAIGQMEGFSEIQMLFESGMAEGVFNGLQDGMYEGIEGIDFSNPITQMLFMLGGLGDITQATIGKELTEGIENTEVSGEPTINVDNPEVDASGVTEEVTQATQEAADSTEPVETTQQVNATAEINTTTADDSGIEEAVNAELATQTMNVGVNAAVSLNVTVSDSNAATVGTTVGQQIGDAIAEGVNSKSEAVSTAASTLGNSAASGARMAYDQMKSAGSYAGQGFQLGLASKRTAILQTARGIANSVAATIKMALDINSPSGVTMALGAYTGEGFDIGLSRSLNKAVRNAEHIVSSMNLAPRMSYPDIEGALSTAASGAYSAEASRPIYLAVNGRILAQAISRDTRIVGNSYNRSVALGVGK